MTVPRLAVVGSINADLVVRVAHLPAPGQTVAGAAPQWLAGGKGANQAVAAARLGAAVAMHGAVADDDAGRMCRAALTDAGVDIAAVRTVPGTTGLAVVAVEDSGENQIIVTAGANEAAQPDTDALRHVDALLMQNEIPPAAMLQAAQACPGLICLNAAPVRDLDPDLMAHVDVLVLNEHEDLAYGSPHRGMVVVTAGAGEAIVRKDGRVVARATPPPVPVVDTVGAGDTFTAAYIVGLASGLDPQQALSRAVVAAALATTAPGAQSAMPTRDDVDHAMGA